MTLCTEEKFTSLRSDEETYYLATDDLGSVLGLFGASGVVNDYRYDPWGSAQHGSTTVSNGLRWAGQMLDWHEGLYAMGARSYDPELGRFLSEDPLGLAAGINPYAYVGNSPVNFVDPMGTDLECGTWDDPCWSSGLFVAVEGSGGGWSFGNLLTVLTAALANGTSRPSGSALHSSSLAGAQLPAATGVGDRGLSRSDPSFGDCYRRGRQLFEEGINDIGEAAALSFDATVGSYISGSLLGVVALPRALRMPGLDMPLSAAWEAGHFMNSTRIVRATLMKASDVGLAIDLGMLAGHLGFTAAFCSLNH